MADGQQVVVFPEGKINRNEDPIQLHQGLARLAQLAQSQKVDVQIVPIGLGYSEVIPKAFGRASICFAEPMKVVGTGREAIKSFNTELSARMHAAEQAALQAVGRIKKAT
jgi:1-acyl-sn-glycerol-3-phosphate acyltransferase